MFLYKLDLKTGRKIDNFIDTIKRNTIKGDFQDAKDSPKYIAKGDSLLGGLSTMEWNEVWYWCERDIGEYIKDFVIDKAVI